MKAVILAGGLGERLRPFTQAIPKSLLPVGEKSLLEIQIRRLAEGGANDIYLATNYKTEYIENFIGDGSEYGVKISYSRETRPLGTCGPLSLLRTELTDPFIVMNGDILTTIDIAKFYAFGEQQESEFTIATKQVATPFNFGRVETQGNRILAVEEKPELYLQVVAGIYFMRPSVLDLVPDDEYYGIDQLINQMLAAGRVMTRYLMDEYWLDIGRIEDYETADEAYETHFKE
jgi:NDP-sugar pyrophosphorylase family protein